MWAELDRDQGHVTNSSWILNHDCDWSIDQGLIWSDWSAGVWGIIHIRFTDRHQNHQWIKLKYFLKEEKRLYCNNNLINNQDQLSARGLRVCRLLWIRSLLWIIKLNWQTSSQTETTGSRSDPGLVQSGSVRFLLVWRRSGCRPGPCSGQVSWCQSLWCWRSHWPGISCFSWTSGPFTSSSGLPGVPVAAG